MAWGKNGNAVGTGSTSFDMTLDTNSTFNEILVSSVEQTQNQEFQFNSDTGNNYSRRWEGNGNEYTQTSVNGAPNAGTAPSMSVSWILNIATEEKLIMSFSCYAQSSGAGNAVGREIQAEKWTNTTDQINTIKLKNETTAVNFTSSSDMTAIGSDLTPAAAVPGLGANIQTGSRFEETDTRKMYNLSDVSTDGLKAYYNFDSISGGLVNQATTDDGLGSSADGTNTSITLDTTNEKLGTGAYSFNGSSSKVVLGTASVWDFLSNATSNTWSIAWWMKYDDTLESGHAIMSTSDGSTQTDGMFIDNSGSGTLRLIQVDGDNGSWSSAIPDNTSWHHYAITWNSGTVTLYVDSVSKGTQSQTAGSGTPQNGLTLGANNDEYYTELTLDDMGIWNRVLTSSEISILYNSGTGRIVDNAKEWQEIGA